MLGRSDMHDLAPGMCADLAQFEQNTLGYVGAAAHDPFRALALGPLIEQHNRLALQLVNGAR